ncbi:MAG TPA: flagellar export protein FliJ [Burkholderiaceae bacterium]|nr:flagellar export protein FliJ [Burkholderiaceae bacterium]
MTNTETLTILLGQHERQRDAAIAEHRRAQDATTAAQGRAEQLRGYRGEYEQRWRAQFGRAGKIELVHCYQSFMERLTLAIAQQSHAAEQAAQQAGRAGVALRDAELRCASVRKLIERRVAEQRLAADRREQKQTDEAATRAAWNRLAATRPAPLM